MKRDIPLDTKENKQINTELKKEILSFLLRDYDNLLNRSQYLSEPDIEKIIDMNLALYETGYLLDLIRHLYRGHDDMEYGLYFSIIKAKDDLDFLKNFKRSFPGNINQKIVYYCKLEKLLNHVDSVKKEYALDSNLVYVNPKWSYGYKLDNSFDYNDDHADFKKNLDNLYRRNDSSFGRAELICQIPLPNELFKFTFSTEMEGGSYKNFRLYEENKKRFIDLKFIET